MNHLSSDFRYGLRTLARTPGATALVLIALSLGIGLCAMMYSLIEGAVLPTLPVAGGDRIVRVGGSDELGPIVDDYAVWFSRQRSFEALGAVSMSTVTLAIEGTGTEPVLGASITPSILPLLSSEPALGRRFTEEDAAPGAPAVVLLGHEVWRDRLGSRPDALGRTVRVNGRPAQVVGVMPEGFGFPWDQKLWTPMHPDPLLRVGDESSRSAEGVAVVGRLREGISAEAAEAELTAITHGLAIEGGGTVEAGASASVSSYTDLLGGSLRSSGLAALMLGIAFLVLLVACANVANVLLARAIARQREIVIRLAIGASRLRIVGQLLVETSLLAAAGAAGGVAIALFGTRYIQAAMPEDLAYWIDVRVDWPVLGFVAIVAVLAALMAGLMPAVQASRSNTHELLKHNGRGASSFRLGRVMRRLIGVEMALSFVLLACAGLFIKSAANFRATEFAFGPEEVYTANIRLPETTYGDDAARARFSAELREAVEGLPAVASAALASDVPGVGSSSVTRFELQSGAGGGPSRSIVVSPGYFELFGARLVSGRDFDARDRAGALSVAVVNEAFARKHFPAGAVDRRVRATGADGDEGWLTIIGVTPDLMAGGVEGEIEEAVYLPLAQHPRSDLTVIARPRGDFASLAGPVRESVAALDRDVALFRVLPLDEVIAQANSMYTWFSALFLVSGGIALFLAALGLYGVMAFWVIQRTREIGVRMALGGQRRDIVRLVVGEGLRQTSIGLAVGVLLALGAARLLSSALYGVAPYDPVVFGSILSVLVAAAWLGCWLPARRATRIDPLEALGAE